jgi:hypothetical protein
MSFMSHGRFGDLLRSAGAAAAHWGNARDRAIAVGEVDRLGEEWADGLPPWKQELTTSIAATVRALAAAPAGEIRQPIAKALGSLVTAGRTAPPVSEARTLAPPRRWWADRDL